MKILKAINNLRLDAAPRPNGIPPLLDDNLNMIPNWKEMMLVDTHNEFSINYVPKNEEKKIQGFPKKNYFVKFFF